MDINYFLLLRGKYNSMLSNINNMIETCVEIDEYTDEYVSNNDRALYIIFNSHANKKNFLEKKQEIQNLKNICNQYIHSLCNHEFVKDDIDIDPDRSKTIIYCQLCDLSDDQCMNLNFINK